MSSGKPTITIHGVLVRVNDVGVLITGEAGTGKSQLALRLISSGHKLIADDVIEIVESNGSLIGTAPETLRGILEVRGIGLVDIRRLFGAESVVESSTIDLCICLDANKDECGMEFLSVEIPRFFVDNSSGRDHALFIETAASVFLNPGSLVSADKVTAKKSDASN